MRKTKRPGLRWHYLPGQCRGVGFNTAVERRKQEASQEGENLDVWH